MGGVEMKSLSGASDRLKKMDQEQIDNSTNHLDSQVDYSAINRELVNSEKKSIQQLINGKTGEIRANCITCGGKNALKIDTETGLYSCWDCNIRGYVIGNKPQARTSWTAADLLASQFPEPKWAIDGIIPEGLNILAGKPKQGKSILALNLCLAISAGGYALGTRVKAGKALYLALEDPGRRLQTRLKKMLCGNHVALENLLLETRFERMESGGIQRLKDKIKQNSDLRLVVIDTLQCFKPLASEKNGNQYESDYQTVGRIKKEIADCFGIAVLIIHHLRKMGAADVFDTFSGTLGLTGAADGLLALTKKGAHSELAIRGRDLEDKAFAIKMDTETLSWQMIGDAEEVQNTSEQQAVLNALKQASKPLSRDEISAISGIKPNTVKNILPKLFVNGLIEKPSYGRYIGK